MILDFRTKEQPQNPSNIDLQSKSKLTKCVGFQIKITNTGALWGPINVETELDVYVCLADRYILLMFVSFIRTPCGEITERNSNKLYHTLRRSKIWKETSNI